MNARRCVRYRTGSLSWLLPRGGWAVPAVILVLAMAKAKAGTIVLEAENGTRLGGVRVSTAVPGYSGTGYLTNFTNDNCRVHWDFTTNAGLYNLLIRYRSPFGPKGFYAYVNGVSLSGTFPSNSAFATFDAGFVELVTGANTLEIGGNWNWYEIDRADLVSVPTPPLPLPVPATLVDTQATFATRMLMQALVDDYGKHTWSGQHEIADVIYVQNVASRKPAIVEGDLMEYSPSRIEYGANPGSYAENYIALENAGHVLSFCWHWNAPTNLLNTPGHEWWSGFYTHATTFDVAAALANTNSVEYALILRDIDAIAVQLKKAASNNVPVLWRPLHESEGGWFWWGAKGAEPFKQLWRLLFNRLTVYHGLHNLIWVLTSSDPAWYPGNDVVDVVGVDAYPPNQSDALSPQWEALKARFDGVKLIALTEFGGVPDIERMQAIYGVWWSWFSPWGGAYGPSSSPSNTVVRIYQSPTVVALDELNAVPPEFTSLNRLADGALQLMGTGPRGSTNRILTATDLTLPMGSWSQIATGRFAGGVFTYTDSVRTNDAARFYRVAKP